MSVINQALRDLEKRGARPSLEGRASLAASHDSVLLNKPSTYWRAFLMACFLGLIGIVTLILLRDSDGSRHPGESAETSLLQGAQLESLEAYESNAKHEGVSQPGTKIASDVVSVSVSEGAESEQPGLGERANTKANLSQNTSARAAQKEPVHNETVVRNAASTLAINSVSSPKSEVAKPVRPMVEEKVEQEFGLKAVRPVSAVTVSPETLDQKNAARSRALAESGVYDVARKQLETFIRENPVHKASLLELAKLLTKMRAYTDLDALLAEPSMHANHEFRMIAARRYLQLDDLFMAQQTLEQRLPPIEKHMHYYSLLASVYQQQGQHLRQADLYQRLIEVHGDRAKWWLGAAIAWDHLKQYDPARRAYQKAQSLQLNDAQLMAFADQRLKQLRGY
jgi:MSHA biogenesis protein MshN